MTSAHRALSHPDVMLVSVDIIWQTGDTWRGLTDDFVTAGVVSVLTENGTVRLVDFHQERQCRVPGTHAMAGDLMWQPLTSALATPCGLYTETSAGAWHCTTRISVAVTGAHAGLATGPLGQHALTHAWSAPEHADRRCITPYCSLEATSAKGFCGHRQPEREQ